MIGHVIVLQFEIGYACNAAMGLVKISAFPAIVTVEGKITLPHFYIHVKHTKASIFNMLINDNNQYISSNQHPHTIMKSFEA